MKKLLLAVMGTALAALAADVTGTWTAEMPGRGGQTMTVTMKLKAEGEILTGTVSNPMGENPIADGKVAGDEITFRQKVEFNGNVMTLLYKGKVAGEEIKFTRQREGGDRVQEFTAKRKPS